MSSQPARLFHSRKKEQLFQYEALDKKNNRITGEINAPSLPRARTLLQAQGLNVLKLKKKSAAWFTPRLGKIHPEDITHFSRQIATMLTSGIPLVQGLTVISEGALSSALGGLVRKIKVDVESGSAFSTALKKNPEYFSELYCNLVASGEQSGSLDIMMNRIAQYQEKSDSLNRKVKKALYYPVSVIVIAFIVTAILLVKVVPTFKDMFKSLGAELPTFTKWILNLSEAVQAYGIVILIGILFTGWVLKNLYKKQKRFREVIQKLSLRLPIFGSIIKKIIIARFARTLSTTSAAGVPLTDALFSVSQASGNIIYSTAIEEIRTGLSSGQTLRFMLKKTGVFPLMVVQMIGIGEESGALESMLGKVATLYEEEVDAAVDGLTSLLEPLIMVILGVIVGGLVVAMYLPIFKMGSLI